MSSLHLPNILKEAMKIMETSYYLIFKVVLASILVDDSTALDALKKIQKKVIQKLFLCFLGSSENGIISEKCPFKVTILSLYWCWQEQKEQIFLIIDEDVLLECSQVSKDHCLFTSSLLTLMAIYYSCNLQYEDDRKHLFKFLEEHILGIIPKRKPIYILKQLENKLLSKMNKALPGSMNAVN